MLCSHGAAKDEIQDKNFNKLSVREGSSSWSTDDTYPAFLRWEASLTLWSPLYLGITSTPNLAIHRHLLLLQSP